MGIEIEMFINKFIIIKLLLITCFVVSCKMNWNDSSVSNLTNTIGNSIPSNNSVDFEKREIIVGNGEDSFEGDIRLSIVNKSELSSAIEYKVISTYKQNDIGFLIEVPKQNTKDNFRMIEFKSLGQPSNNFIKTLSELYKIKSITNSTFKSNLKASYVDLEELTKEFGKTNGDEERNIKKFKLFFENEKNTEEQAELYLNINDKEGWIELLEKDEEYRPLIIKFFSKAAN